MSEALSGAAAVVAALALYVWWTEGERRDAKARLTQWRDDCCKARALLLEERAKNRRLRHQIAYTGITPPRDSEPWVDPDPRPVYGPPVPVPPAPAWCHEPVPEADPEGELVGGVFHLDARLVTTSEVVLPWLETA